MFTDFPKCSCKFLPDFSDAMAESQMDKISLKVCIDEKFKLNILYGICKVIKVRKNVFVDIHVGDSINLSNNHSFQ